MNPLSKKVRLGSGIFLGIIFIILAPILLANSFGYHFDKLEDVFTLVKSGGIYVASDVSGIEIYVNGEYFKDSGLFIKNTLVQDLNPDESHEIVAQKVGRNDWRKTLPVYESLVTETRVLMLPIEIETIETYPFVDELGIGTSTATTTLKKNTKLEEEILVDGYVPTNEVYRDLINLFHNEETDVYSTTTSLIDDELQTNVSLKDDTTTTSTPTLPLEKNIPEYFLDLGIEDPDGLVNLIELNYQVAWLDGGDIILNWINKKENPVYYYCLEHNKCREQIILDWESEIVRFNLLPGRDDVFVILTKEGIYAVEVDDRSQRNIQPIYLGNNLDFRIDSNNKILVKDGSVFHEMIL